MKKFMSIFLLGLLFIWAIPAFANPGSSHQGKIVVVDPGHGGYDPGTVNGKENR